MNYKSKHHRQIKTRSEKLFKIDGITPVDVWVELTCHFFAGNPLALEYFEGVYPPHPLELLEKIKV